MNRIALGATLALIAADTATAQQAVQWRVQDGGNGHWYRAESVPEPGLNWFEARDRASNRGGHLPTVSSEAENTFIISTFLGVLQEVGGWGPALGGTRTGTDPTSACQGWRWVTDEPFSFVAPFPGDPSCCNYAQCDSVCQCLNDFYPGEDSIHYWHAGYLVWNSAGTGQTSRVVLTEWSADCNQDGIVDYGQIVNGTFTDLNANGVPDCCEQGPPCAPCAIADLFRDRNVNGGDLGILLAQWGPNTPVTVADLNADGTVDGNDLGLLLSFWGPCPY